ncbi:unnamed protein product [Paramecium primaurelia]|uniref:Uncharacterized protein n=2 Tax=Paramecium TaxID=5884 RepID=A0A8S1UJW8_9CILI|nr:unnamed protein product [Paramecium primaurelia]CAD8165120.1 unnamed protein product [Paramecium pentaurelia]
MNRRFKTEIQEKHLNYDQEYESILIVKEEENKNYTPSSLFSLQFYQKQFNKPQKQPSKTINRFKSNKKITLSSLKQAQAIYSPSLHEKPQRIHAPPTNFRIKLANFKYNLNTISKQSLHTPSTKIQDSQHQSGYQTPLDIKMSISKIQQLLSSSKLKSGQLDFTKFKKSIY